MSNSVGIIIPDYKSPFLDDVIKINSENYKVRSARKIDDGSFCLVSLTKT